MSTERLEKARADLELELQDLDSEEQDLKARAADVKARRRCISAALAALNGGRGSGSGLTRSDVEDALSKELAVHADLSGDALKKAVEARLRKKGRLTGLPLHYEQALRLVNERIAATGGGERTSQN